MSARGKGLALVLGLAAVAVVLAIALSGPIRRSMRPLPRLAPARLAAQEGRLDEAEALLDKYLDVFPRDAEARLLDIRLLIDRPNPRPEKGLKAIEGFPQADPSLAAVVEVYRGKALFQLDRLGVARQAWEAALRLDPTVGEAGWLLLQLDYLQDRRDLAGHRALAMFETEPDRIDQVGLLLELVRQDVETLATAEVVKQLGPAVRNDPDDLPTALAYAVAFVREGHAEEGVALLRKAVAARPTDLDARDALLEALGDSGDLDGLARALAELPVSMIGSPRLAAHRGRLSLERRDYAAALAAYDLAESARRFDLKVAHRHATAARRAGSEARAKAIEAVEERYKSSIVDLKDLYSRVDAQRKLGLVPTPAVDRVFADLRESMGRPAEALAWHRLALRADPADATSAAAVARLSAAPRGG